MRALPRPLEQRLREGGRGLTVVVTRLAAMGDILRTLPAVRLIRKDCPEATLLWLLDDRWASVLEGHPDLSGLVRFPRKGLGGSVRQRAALLGDFRSELRNHRADLFVDFHGNLRSGLCGFASGAPVRLGYAGHQQKEGNFLFTTHRVAAGERRTPRLARNLDLVRALGIETGDPPGGALPLVARGQAAAVEVLGAVGLAGLPYATLSPATSRAQAYKIPPAGLFAAACRRLAERGLPVLLVWGPGEREYAERVAALSGDAARVAPATDLAALAALIAGGRMYVGADSGPLHLACAVGCPTLAIYGPTDPVVNGPWGVPFRAVAPPGRTYTGIKRLDRKQGFEGITANAVAAEVDALLGDDRVRARATAGA